MIDIHILSLMVGVLLCALISPRLDGRFFESFRPWRKRIHPWPGRQGGIRGKGTVDLKSKYLPSGPSGIQRVTRELRVEVENRIPPRSGSVLPRLPRPDCVTSFNAYSGMWRGTPKQLAEWVLAEIIPLSSIDPSIRPNVEDICVEKYK